MSAGKLSAWREVGPAAALVAVGALGAALEGGIEPRYGGAVAALAALVAGAHVLRGGVPAPPRPVVLALAVLAAAAAASALPWPSALRAVLAPGQSEVLARALGATSVTSAAWTEALVRFDVEAAVGLSPRWSFDLLAGVEPPAWRAGATPLRDQGAALAPWLAALLVGAAGAKLGRRSQGALAIAAGLVVVGVAEALWGLGNRDAGTTGLNDKTSYLGSATGSFVNRGHFGALLVLAVGGGWGLAASLFPLLPEEVRRHRDRKRRSSQPPGILEASGDKLPRLALLAFAGGLLVVGLVASQARGPLVALAVAGLAVGGWARWRRGELVHLGLGAALPLAGVLLASIAMGPRAAIGRFAQVFGSESSLDGRMAAWSAAIDAFRAAPVLGWGLGSWPAVHPVFESGPHLFRFGHAHSEPLELAVELGAVGLVAVAALLVSWLRSAAARIDRAEHDARTAVGVGFLAAALAVLVQGIGDFPLRSPGVLLPWALALGTSIGALADVEAPSTSSRAWTRVLGVVAILAAVLGAAAAARDARAPGTREERLSGMTPLWIEDHPQQREAVLAWQAAGQAAVQEAPLDAWAHLVVAEASARAATGPSAGRRAFAAEVAVARALALVRRDPRLQVSAASVLARLQDAQPTRDAYAERATALLASAVHDDTWRADSAFRVAAVLPAASLERIAASAGTTPFDRSRVGYQLGRAWERRKDMPRALAAHGAAFEADPSYGPPAFARGAVHRAQGDAEAAAAWLRRFLESRERPGAMEGWALYFLGDLAGAEARLRRVVEAEPRNAWAWTALAQVAHDGGNRSDEREAWGRVVALNPGDEHARRRLDAVSSDAP